MKSAVIQIRIYQTLKNINMKHLTTKLHRYRHFLYCLLAVVFIWWFKVAVDNWNKDAIRHNAEMKKNCPYEKWHYVTKGQWECDCPQNNR